MPIERKLAAIMFTDIAGYTEQMSKDEDKAFALIQKKRELLLPLIEQYEGKLIKEMGDGTLTRYFKADNAIDCASSFQAKTDSDLNVRAGIHTGEVIVDKEDVFGDVVNVASRLESIAVPGSVLVSKETIDKLEMSDKLELESLGMKSLKGVGRLI
jgi:class 3 adenylate cyclase